MGCELSREKLENPGAAVNYLLSRYCSLGPLIQMLSLQILAVKGDNSVCNSVLFSSEPHFCPGVLCGRSGGWQQQAQKSLSQPNAHCRCDMDGLLSPFLLFKTDIALTTGDS